MMQKVLSLFSLTPENVGDMACSWGNQYENFKISNFGEDPYNSYGITSKNVAFGHINDHRSDYDQFDLIVVGGGGIINKSHEEGIWRVINQSKKCMIRSVGVKDWDFAHKIRDIIGDNFTIRHVVDGFTYEACPSLVFVDRYKTVHGVNKEIKKTDDMLFAMHQNNKKEIEILQEKGFNYIVNNCELEYALQKISCCKKIITSSYHFLLWANEFNCDIELFQKDSNKPVSELDKDSDMLKFINIPVKFEIIDIKKYLN